MDMSNYYIVLSYYSFFNVENPALEVERHRLYCSGLDILGRIYIADNGINGQVSLHISEITGYLEWLEVNWNITKNDCKLYLMISDRNVESENIVMNEAKRAGKEFLKKL